MIFVEVKQMCSAVFERIDQLMKTEGKKNQELNDYLGLTRSAYDNWKSGKSKSFEKHIDRIANFLNVTPSFLLYGKDIPPTPFEKKQEDELLLLFRKVNQDVKNSILIILNAAVTQES